MPSTPTFSFTFGQQAPAQTTGAVPTEPPDPNADAVRAIAVTVAGTVLAALILRAVTRVPDAG